MVKNLISCPPIFRGLYLYYMLDIVASYHRIQFQQKIMIQTQENGKNLILGLL